MSGREREGGILYSVHWNLPHTISSQLPLGMAPLCLVNFAKSERDRARPLRVRK